MTQLELPPISFARYIDLLKRRRWQVVPVSLLGLMIGGLVAFFVPRYYVAETILQYRGDVLELDASAKNPMAPLLQSARMTIYFSTEETIRDLGWPDAKLDDPEAFRSFEQAVRGRIRVRDWRDDRGDRIAHIAIEYKDTDGTRAMDFTNRLRELWIKQQTTLLREQAATELADISDQIRVFSETQRDLDLEIVAFQKNNDINPFDEIGGRERGMSPSSRERGGVEKQIQTLKTKVGQIEIELERAIEARVKEPLKRFVAKDAQIPDVLKLQLTLARLAVTGLEKAKTNTNPNHPDHAAYLRRLEAAKGQYQDLVEMIGLDEKIETDNPLFVRAKQNVERLETDLATTSKALADARARHAVLVIKTKQDADLMKDYTNLNERRDAARDRKQELQDARANMEARKYKLNDPGPLRTVKRAQVPPRPTEPNISLVALAGSAIGLAVAIGLILLFDALQTTFKTLDDVQRGVSVPLLGGMSYMVTDEQRRASKVRRTRTGVVAAGFLLLMLSMITIYYAAPTRLPSAVRDTLDVLLKTPTPVEAPR